MALKPATTQRKAAPKAAKRTLIGYQIADMNGDLIQGDGSCPVDFQSFEVLTVECAHQVMTKLTEMELDHAYMLQPIAESDVEDCEMVKALTD